MSGPHALPAARDRQRRAPLARPCVLIDSREQAPLAFSDAVEVEHGVTLPTGDYSLKGFTESVAIERKSKADLVACVGPERERFLEQMTRLAGYQVRALVVEASREELSSGAYGSSMNPKSATGTLLALVEDRGITPVLLGGGGEGGGGGGREDAGQGWPATA